MKELMREMNHDWKNERAGEKASREGDGRDREGRITGEKGEVSQG